MADCSQPTPSGCYTCLTDRQLLALTAEHLCSILENGIPSGPPVGIQDVNVVSSIGITVSVDNFPAAFGRTWNLDFATDQVDVTGSAVSVTNFPTSFSVTQGTSPWVVSSTDLDIRNLVFATDKVDASGSVVSLDAASLAALETVTVLQGTSPWVVIGTFTPSGTQDVNIISSITLTVQATDLDIRNLVFATDKVDASGSSVSVSNFPASQVVTATDLDIRNLVFATDKVDVGGSIVALDAGTLAALETITVLQGTSPWVVSGTVTATPTGTQDVNVISSITLTVQATDLDIRNLVFATDKVDASGSSVSVSNFPATVAVTQSTSPWVVSLTSTTITGTVAATQSGTWTEANSAAIAASTASVDGKLPDVSGTWGYNSGVSGTLVLSGGKRVLQITAIAEEAAATITINGGDTITLPYGTTDKVSSAITIEPKGNLTNPTIIFTATKAWFVEYVT